MRLLLRWLVAAASLWVTLFVLQSLYPQGAHLYAEKEPVLMLLTVLVLGFANAFIRPLVKLLTLPLNCLTFGLFSFVINAVLFWGVGTLTGAYKVDWIAALIGSIAMAAVNGTANHLIVDRE